MNASIPKTFIFIGRSGSGKGTQARLLEEYLTKEFPAKILYVETGTHFREFTKRPSLSGKIAKAVSECGKRQPDFLAVWMWSHIVIDELKGDEHLIIDGTPRSDLEAKVLHTAIEFYKRKNTVVVYLDVSRAWSEKHLLSRGRADDSKFDIDERLNWFDRDVLPAVEFYKAHPEYKLLRVNGEQSVEAVHTEIIASLT